MNRYEKPNRSVDDKSVKGEEKGPWKRVLFSKRSDASLEYVKLNLSKEGDKVRISIPSEIAALGVAKWSNCLVGFFLGKKVPFYQVKSYVDKNWSRFGVVGVNSYGHEGYLLNFLDEITKLDVLEGGPWFIGGQPFFLKLWSPNLKSGMNGVTRVPIWAKFYGIPLELWTPKGLSHIASVIGTLFYMDNITELGDRLEFAKVCVEMGSSLEFKEEFELELELPNGEIVLVKVEYAWKPFTCAWCKTFGHVQRNCQLAPKESGPLPPKKPTTSRAQEWRQVAGKKNMIVSQQPSQERVEEKKEHESAKPCERVNQFVVLSEEGEEKRMLWMGRKGMDGMVLKWSWRVK